MKRREFITLLGGAAAAWPVAARAQRQRKIWRVGFLEMPLRPAVLESSRYAAFARGMRELGYVEGDNLAIEYRFAEGEPERLSNLVAELVELKPDVLVVAGTQAVGAAQEATTSIPIVMATTNDPIGSGFVQGLARPGGNITGLSNLSTDLSPKLMEMLRSIAPKLSRVAILVNPTNQSHAPVVASLRAAAQGVNLEIGTVEAATPQEIESAFSSMNQQNAGAVIVAADAFFIQQGPQIADLARKHRMPSRDRLTSVLIPEGLY
jgi:putative ABC transport system substrate-binding protein